MRECLADLPTCAAGTAKATLVAMVVSVMLRGCMEPVINFSTPGRDLFLAQAVDFCHTRTFSAATLILLLRSHDAVPFKVAQASWIAARTKTAWPMQHVTIAGKALRGGSNGEAPGKHLIANYGPARRGHPGPGSCGGEDQ